MFLGLISLSLLYPTMQSVFKIGVSGWYSGRRNLLISILKSVLESVVISEGFRFGGDDNSEHH